MSSHEMLSWLKATIEGDKAAAKANGGETWTAHDEGADDNWTLDIGDGHKTGESCGCCCKGTLDEVEAEHMARHDPRDTIARCEAELALLDKLLPELEQADDLILGEWGSSDDLAKKLLVTLVAGRRHRPGFNPKWVEG
ncbi:DUF6221 family protein [Nonomuraea bangladeshensis]|uniref:DUF6221 family protein n=1 Tax=Nonomuraea bangladeshensis TaxID=404385 RepID=UPI003C30A1AE